MLLSKQSTNLLATAIFITVLIVSCSNEKTENSNVPKVIPVKVIVAKADQNDIAGYIQVGGQVEAVQIANISTRVMGYITKVYVKIGDPVKKGQLLFKINSADILARKAQSEAMITQANAAEQNAQKDYERFSILYKQQSATAKELDNVTLQINAAKAATEAARQMRNEVGSQLSYTNVTAPFEGVVTQKYADAGSMATPGMPVVTIEQANNLQVSAAVGESQISSIKKGDEAALYVKSIQKTIIGHIEQISLSAQSNGGQYLIKISIPDKDKKQVLAGMYVNVTINIKEPKKTIHQYVKNNIVVPIESIVQKDQLTGLYTISNLNTALLRWVRLGKVSGKSVEVLSGLSMNETYIVQAEGRLYNGIPVEIKK
jgi:RND family efflux transporter MFP subunit